MNGQHRLRAELQRILNEAGDGWVLADYVFVLGLQKMDSAGRVETMAWVLAPDEQADYVTDGLLWSAEEMRANADIDED